MVWLSKYINAKEVSSFALSEQKANIIHCCNGRESQARAGDCGGDLSRSVTSFAVLQFSQGIMQRQVKEWQSH
jgi:hypothetical protein